MAFDAEETWARLVHLVELNRLGDKAPRRPDLRTQLVGEGDFLPKSALSGYIGSVATAFYDHGVPPNFSYRNMRTPQRPVLGPERTFIGVHRNEARLDEYKRELARTSFWGRGITVWSRGSGSVATGPGNFSSSPLSDGNYTSDAPRTAGSGFTSVGLGITCGGSFIRWGNGHDVLQDYTSNDANLRDVFKSAEEEVTLTTPNSPQQKLILQIEAFSASMLSSLVSFDVLTKSIS